MIFEILSEIFGEIVVEIFAYGTYALIERVFHRWFHRLPDKLEKLCYIVIGVALWAGIIFLVIKLLETLF